MSEIHPKQGNTILAPAQAALQTQNPKPSTTININSIEPNPAVNPESWKPVKDNYALAISQSIN